MDDDTPKPLARVPSEDLLNVAAAALVHDLNEHLAGRAVTSTVAELAGAAAGLVRTRLDLAKIKPSGRG